VNAAVPGGVNNCQGSSFVPFALLILNCFCFCYSWHKAMWLMVIPPTALLPKHTVDFAKPAFTAILGNTFAMQLTPSLFLKNKL
jgi:hypothetical protein